MSYLNLSLPSANQPWRTIGLVLCALFVLSACQSTYYSAWEKLGVEKRDILVDRVENARDSQTEAQAQFSSALEEFQVLINYDGGELETVYDTLSDQYDDAKASAEAVSDRIESVEQVAAALFAEWQEELNLYTNANLKRDSEQKLRTTKRQYNNMIKAMRRVESRMPPVLSALQNNVLYLKHNLNANAIGALQGELQTIRQDVTRLVDEMNAAIKQSDNFIQAMQG